MFVSRNPPVRVKCAHGALFFDRYGLTPLSGGNSESRGWCALGGGSCTEVLCKPFSLVRGFFIGEADASRRIEIFFSIKIKLVFLEIGKKIEETFYLPEYDGKGLVICCCCCKPLQRT